MKPPFLFFLAAVLALAGCHSVPRTITLPTVAAVRAPIVIAQTHVARAVQIGKQEQALLKQAGSQGLSAARVRQVSALLTADAAEKQGAADQLTAALYQTGSLQKELDAKQAQCNALARDDAAKTVKVGTLEKVLHRWQLALLLLVVADYFAGAFLQRGAHWLLALAGRSLLLVWRGVAIPLKTAFPLYLFWLPA